MPPPPLPAANSTSGNGPFPAGSRSPIGAYTPSIISTYMSWTGNGDSFTASVTTTFCGSTTATPDMCPPLLEFQILVLGDLAIALERVGNEPGELAEHEGLPINLQGHTWHSLPLGKSRDFRDVRQILSKLLADGVHVVSILSV